MRQRMMATEFPVEEPGSLAMALDQIEKEAIILKVGKITRHSLYMSERRGAWEIRSGMGLTPGS